MQKKIYIEDLQEGNSVDELFMVKQARLGETRAGKPYLALTLADKSGEIGGPVWDNAEAMVPVCAAGAIVRVRGQVQSYREKLQLRIEMISPVPADGYRLDDFVAASRRDADLMQEELFELVASLRDVSLKKLVNRLLVDRESGEEYRSAPAAKVMHHAYLGGLLEHSLSVARIASQLAGHYSLVDRDLLVAGALLHDVGKMYELSQDAGIIDYTDAGRLKGHLVIGCELIGREARAIEGFPGDLLLRLQHLVLSHHGRLEYGSPVLPMTAEALLFCLIDDMDAKMNQIDQLRRKAKPEKSVWSDYQRGLERYLLLDPLEKKDGVVSSPEESSVSARQGRLF